MQKKKKKMLQKMGFLDFIFFFLTVFRKFNSDLLTGKTISYNLCFLDTWGFVVTEYFQKYEDTNGTHCDVQVKYFGQDHKKS